MSWPVGVLVAGALLAGCADAGHRVGGGPGARGPARPAAPTSPTSPVPPAALVLRDGVTVHGSGTVLARPGHPVRFCAPVVVPLPTLPRGAEPVPCDIGVDVTGIDLSAVTDRQEDHGTVTGLAAMTGVYRRGTLAVTQQGPPDPYPGSTPDHVPCPAPPGGWAHGPADENLDLSLFEHYLKRHPGAIVFMAQLRPSRTQVVRYALTAGDPAPVRAALQAESGGDRRLCMTQSRWTAAQKDAAQRAFDPSGPRNLHAGIWGVGRGLRRDAQEVVIVDLAYVTDELAARAEAFPSGLIEFHPWLAPAG